MLNSKENDLDQSRSFFHFRLASTRAMVRELISNLVADVAYGSTKELLRAMLAASFTTLLLATRPAANNQRSWRETLRLLRERRWMDLVKFAGAIAILMLFILVFFDVICACVQH